MDGSDGSAAAWVVGIALTLGAALAWRRWSAGRAHDASFVAVLEALAAQLDQGGVAGADSYRALVHAAIEGKPPAVRPAGLSALHIEVVRAGPTRWSVHMRATCGAVVHQARGARDVEWHVLPETYRTDLIRSGATRATYVLWQEESS